MSSHNPINPPGQKKNLSVQGADKQNKAATLAEAFTPYAPVEDDLHAMLTLYQANKVSIDDNAKNGPLKAIMDNTLRVSNRAMEILTFKGNDVKAQSYGAPNAEAIYRLQRQYGNDIRGVQALAQLLGEEATEFERRAVVEGLARGTLHGKPGNPPYESSNGIAGRTNNFVVPAAPLAGL